MGLHGLTPTAHFICWGIEGSIKTFSTRRALTGNECREGGKLPGEDGTETSFCGCIRRESEGRVSVPQATRSWRASSGVWFVVDYICRSQGLPQSCLRCTPRKTHVIHLFHQSPRQRPSRRLPKGSRSMAVPPILTTRTGRD